MFHSRRIMLNLATGKVTLVTQLSGEAGPSGCLGRQGSGSPFFKL